MTRIYRVSLSIKYLLVRWLERRALLLVLMRFLMYRLLAETLVSLTIMELIIIKVLSR